MRLTASKILIVILLGFFAGIFLAPLFGFSWWVFLGILFLLGLVFFFFRQESWVKLSVIFAAGLVLALGYYQFYLCRQEKNTIQNFNNQEVYIIGYISTEPDVRAEQIKYIIQVQRFGKNNKGQVKGKILVTMRRLPVFQFADQIEIRGKLEEPKIYPDFNYKNYLARYQIYSVMNFPEIKVIGSILDDPNLSFLQKFWIKIQKNLFLIKSIFTQKIGQLIPEPWSAFLAGILLGAKKAIPENLMDIFNRTGTTHIVVISGYNITIIVFAFMMLTRRWNKKLTYSLAIPTILAFVIMTGAQAPVLRAAIMAGLVVWAERAGRKADVTIALVIAAAIMILANPLILRFDLGFQLSFLATLGLVWFSPILEKIFSMPYLVKIPKLIADPAIATISAQLLVVPVILFNFGRVSLIAPLANIFVLPLIPMVMGIGFLAGTLGMIWLELGKIFGWTAWLILRYITWILEIFDKIPAASFQIGKFSWVWLAGYYGLVIGFLVWYNKKRKLKTQGSNSNEN